MQGKNRELKRKLFKFEQDHSTVDLDPFEMHKKIRYYQSKLEISDIMNVKAEEKLKEIDKVFSIMGITLQDLKDSCKHGKS